MKSSKKFSFEILFFNKSAKHKGKLNENNEEI